MNSYFRYAPTLASSWRSDDETKKPQRTSSWEKSLDQQLPPDQTYSNVDAAGMWVTVTVCWRRVRVRDYRMVMSITSACCCWWEPRVVAAWHEPDAASGRALHSTYLQCSQRVNGRWRHCRGSAARGRVRESERTRVSSWTLRGKLGSSVVRRSRDNPS